MIITIVIVVMIMIIMFMNHKDAVDNKTSNDYSNSNGDIHNIDNHNDMNIIIKI